MKYSNALAAAMLAAVKAKLDSNELHALSITQALTPEEWAQKA